MKIFLKQIFTGKDNQTNDIFRISIAIGLLVFFGLEIYNTIYNHIFNAMEFGGGFGSIIACGGVGIGAKAKTEPE